MKHLVYSSAVFLASLLFVTSHLWAQDDLAFTEPGSARTADKTLKNIREITP